MGPSSPYQRPGKKQPFTLSFIHKALTTGTPQFAGGLLLIAPVVAWLGRYFMGLQLLTPSWGAAAWAFALAPLLEEYVFRSLLQCGLQQRLPATWRAGHLANLLTAGVFVAAHYPAHGWRAAAWLVPALALGELWRRTGKLWPSVLMHSWFNLSLAGMGRFI